MLFALNSAVLMTVIEIQSIVILVNIYVNDYLFVRSICLHILHKATCTLLVEIKIRPYVNQTNLSICNANTRYTCITL